MFLISLLSGIAALVVVSLLTPAEPADAMASFFGRLNTPHETTEEEGTTGTPPTHASPIEVTRSGRQLLLVHLLNPWRATGGVGFFRAYREDLVGFATGWVLVVGLVLLTLVFFSSNL